MEPNIGKNLHGRYRTTELIGMGNISDVYKAHDFIGRHPVAVKIYRSEFSNDKELLKHFNAFSRSIEMLSHPNIVKVFDYGFTDEKPFIVMEYIDGINLKEYIQLNGAFNWQDALFFITQILRALLHAHSKGVIHRDIKPQNIMILKDGTAKVNDFGLAKMHPDNDSVFYTAPEKAMNLITDGLRADIYSVGVMLYEMLTGRKPFDGKNVMNVAAKHIRQNVKPPQEIMPTIPEALNEIVIHAMEKNPSRRYQSVAEMITDIDAFRNNPSVVFGYKKEKADSKNAFADSGRHHGSTDKNDEKLRHLEAENTKLKNTIEQQKANSITSEEEMYDLTKKMSNVKKTAAALMQDYRDEIKRITREYEEKIKELQEKEKLQNDEIIKLQKAVAEEKNYSDKLRQFIISNFKSSYCTFYPLSEEEMDKLASSLSILNKD